MGQLNEEDSEMPSSAIKLQDQSSASNEPMDILRCAPMSLLQLYIPMEAAQATVAELGSIGLVQFRDVRNQI